MGKKRPDVKELIQKAREVRKDILSMLYEAGSGHPGGSLSCVEIIMSIFYYKLRNNPKNPTSEDRDRFILSKGHGCPTLYAVMAHTGYIKKEELKTLRKYGSHLQGHPSKKWLPLMEVSSGSLGQGLSISNGMCLGAKMDGKDSRTYCLMGDGEIQEGQVWEAAMTSSHYKLDNLVGIIDYNKMQIDGYVREIKDIEPLRDKWESFGWAVLEADGHSFEELMDALDRAEETTGKPTCIIAHTVKGKGVSFMEDKLQWHGVAPDKDQTKDAVQELEKKSKKKG